MKYILIILVLLCTILPLKADDGMFDVDYNFIDTAFDGIKPITDKEFNDTIRKLTPQPVENSFKGRLKSFLFGRKYGVEEAPLGQDKEIDYGGELKAIQDLKNGVYYIKLLTSIITQDGKIIPLGNYKIQEEKIENQSMLVFYQGHKEYGKLKLQTFEDNLKNENDLTYSRVDFISDNVVRIVYSTLDDTKCAHAKVYLQN